MEALVIDPGSIAAWASAALAAAVLGERLLARAKDDTSAWRQRTEEKLDRLSADVVGLRVEVVQVAARVVVLGDEVGRLRDREDTGPQARRGG